MIKIISIDDHKLFFEGLLAIMQKEEDLHLINGFSEIDNLAKLVEKEQPDVFLLDVYLQGVSGISLAKFLKSEYPHIKIVMLSMEVDSTYFQELTSIGVEGYFSKELDASQLIEIIRKVYQGSTDILMGPVFASTSKSDILVENFNLTDREIEVLEYINRGYTNQAIANILHRSVWTIKTHRKNIKQKLSIKNGFKLPVDLAYLNDETLEN